MAKPVSIFGDAALGSLFFEGLRIPPAPLGGVVVAIEHPGSLTGRIRVTRSDLFQKDGVIQGLSLKECVLLELGIKITKDLLQILDLLYNRLLITLMTKQTEKQTKLTLQKDGTAVGSGTQ